MKNIVVWRALVVGALGGILGLAAPAARAQDNGIFADFTTSAGAFTCRLDYTNAPQAVANFIGLATGRRAWLDVSTGEVRTNAFYNGLTFHRVIAGFMIQGGSPNGQGTDGPGYVFPDEFSPSLRHDAPGVLSLANSGPDSNGAQFFITVTNTPWLNDVHTIMGRVVSGMPVVYAISRVSTDANSKPLTNVTVQTVSIRRVGTAAQAFDIQAQNLPIVSKGPVRIARGTGEVTLAYSNNLYQETFLCSSSNLTRWTNSTLGVDVLAPASNSVKRATAAAAQFYSVSRVQYPSSTFAPRGVQNRTLTLLFNAGIGNLTNHFNAADGGTYSFNGSTGTITGYSWSQEIYRGRLWPIYFSALVPMTLRLDFTSNGGGTFSGTAYASNPVSVSGNFALSAP